MSQRADSPLAMPSVANIGSDFMKLNVDIATVSGWLERLVRRICVAAHDVMMVSLVQYGLSLMDHCPFRFRTWKLQAG